MTEHKCLYCKHVNTVRNQSDGANYSEATRSWLFAKVENTHLFCKKDRPEFETLCSCEEFEWKDHTEFRPIDVYEEMVCKYEKGER